MNMQHFGLRGRQEHTTMTMENFLFMNDENGEKYVEFLKDPTKDLYLQIVVNGTHRIQSEKIKLLQL